MLVNAALACVLLGCDADLPLDDTRSSITATIEPAEVSLPDDERISLTVRFSRGGGAEIPAPRLTTIKWEIEDTTIARIDAEGNVEGRRQGTTTADALIILPGPVAIRRSVPITVLAVPHGIELVGGNGQSAEVGTPLPAPIVARVVDRFGAPVAGSRIEFERLSQAGSEVGSAAGSAVSDESGIVTFSWLLADGSGRQEIRAAAAPHGRSRRSLTGPTIFAIARAAEPVRIEKTGDGQTGHPGEALTSTLGVHVADRYGNPVPGVQLVWSVISGGGAVVGLSDTTATDGTAEARWTLGLSPGSQSAAVDVSGITGHVLFTAAAGTLEVRTIEIAGGATLASLGETNELVATARAADGSLIRAPGIAWVSLDPTVASVDPAGRVTAVGNGVARIVARASAAADTATVEVWQVVVSAEVDPPQLMLASIGQTSRLTFAAYDGRGQVVSGRTGTWTSASPIVAAVDSTGLVTAKLHGETEIILTVDGLHSTVPVTVGSQPAEPTVASITLTPSTATLQPGDSIELAATARDPAGQAIAGVSLIWSTSNPGVATVDSGVVRAVATGSVSITASARGKSATAQLSVSAPPQPEPGSITVTPEYATIASIGGTMQLNATLRDDQGEVLSGVPVTWSTATPALVTVQDNGMVIAKTAGSALIIASAAELADSATIEVGHSGVYTVPDTIDTTGGRDVTTELLDFFGTVPDGSTVQFPARARYRIEGTLRLVGRNGMTFEGNGATFLATIPAPYGNWNKDRTRSQWKIEGGSDLVFRNLVIKGANPNAGTATEAYVADLEAQHGFDIWGVDGLELDAITITDVYGDFVYVSNMRGGASTWSRNVWIHDSHFERNGRQGIAIDGSDGVVVEDNYIGQTRRASIDLEPYNASSGMRDITVRNNRFGPGRLMFIAAASTAAATIENVLVEKNILEGKTMNVSILSPTQHGTRHKNISFIGNTTDATFGSPVALMRFKGIDGLTVTGNHSPIAVTQSMKAVEVWESCDVNVTANNFTGASLALVLNPFPCS